MHEDNGTAGVAVLRASFEDFNKGDVDALMARLMPDFVINIAGVPQRRGRDTWRQGIEYMRQAFPDIHAEVEDIFGAGDRVAVRLTFSGTHRGEFQGIPATGRKVSYSSNELYRVNGDVIEEEWICSDMATLMAQLS